MWVKLEAAASYKFVLITSLYCEKDPNRIEEYKTCITQNLSNKFIDHICVVYDTSHDDADKTLYTFLTTQPITIITVDRRPTYTQCFTLANEMFPQRLVIIANGDIYFNNTLKYLVYYSFTNKFLALTRWEPNAVGKLRIFSPSGSPAVDSQDAWIFRTPLRNFINSDFELGIAGCDNALAYWAHRSGFRVLNPSLTIQAIHVHQSNIRTWDPVSPYKREEMMMLAPHKMLKRKRKK